MTSAVVVEEGAREVAQVIRWPTPREAEHITQKRWLLIDGRLKGRESADLHSTLPNRKQGINLSLDFIDTLVMLILNRLPLLLSTLLALQNSELGKYEFPMNLINPHLLNNSFGCRQDVLGGLLCRDRLGIFLGLAFNGWLAFAGLMRCHGGNL